jgi:hypothetical protein
MRRHRLGVLTASKQVATNAMPDLTTMGIILGRPKSSSRETLDRWQPVIPERFDCDINSGGSKLAALRPTFHFTDVQIAQAQS